MIIVTGGAGFIGSCIVSRLNAMGIDDLVIVDHLLSGDIKKKNLEHKRYRRFLDKTEFLRKIRKGIFQEKADCVIHMGACSSTTGQDENYYRSNNTEYSCHLANWAKVNGSRFIYASSAATYGEGEQGYSDADESTRKLRPLNLYGESKQRFDLWVLEQGFEKEMVGLKFFNVFGPNEYHKSDMRSVVAKAFPKVVAEGRMQLFKSYRPEYGDGEQKRDFIYVKDAVDVVMFFMENRQANGIFNVGTGKARSWNDLATAMFAAADKPLCVDYIDMPEHLRARYQYFTQAEMDKLRKAGYAKEFTPLESAVADYAGYLQKGAYL
ncbi:MAG: ADP-glyceromanno-heptose 6-epimerase [Candidatus Omnitrophota bacterium]|nr:ADP-glyceromanno-heptose 6-epimerase [Candidatus Omnitrophota bacterium]MDZ4243454.1 ADP-glyceromanno-heptose 6-epimerase [Candidatus Omnitrophota bacterium]